MITAPITITESQLSSTTTEQTVVINATFIEGVKGDPGPASTVAGPPGASPVISILGDQITVDGSIVGPHLTGPPGPAVTALAELASDSTHRTVSDTEKGTWNGKQDALGFTAVPNSRTVAGHALTADITITNDDVPISKIGTPSVAVTERDFLNLGWSAGVISGGDITDHGDGTLDIAAGEAVLRNTANTHAGLISLAFAGITGSEPTNHTTTYYFVDYNAASPHIVASTILTSFNCLDKCHLYTITRDDNILYILDAREQNVDSNRKVRKRNYETNPYAHILGGSLLGSAGLSPTVTAGGFYFSLVRLPHDAFDCSLVGTTSDRVFISKYRSAVPDVWTTDLTAKEIDTDHYDDGTGSLHALTTEYFGVHWIYLAIGATPRLISVYGTGDHPTLTDAKAASIPAILPPLVLGACVLLGQCIVQKGNTTIDLVQSAFNVSFVPGGADLPVVAGGNAQIQYNSHGVLAASPNNTWDNDAQSVNIGQSTILPDNPLAISGSSAGGYLQLNIQNRNPYASSDLILTASDGNDSIKYVDVGISNPLYTSALWPLFTPWSMYVFPERKNLYLGTLDSTAEVVVFVSTTDGEAHDGDSVAVFDSTGVDIPAGKAIKTNGIDIKSHMLAISSSMAMGGF